MSKEVKFLAVGAVLTLCGAIMTTGGEGVVIAGMVVGAAGLLFLIACLLVRSRIASYYREDSGAEQEPGTEGKG